MSLRSNFRSFFCVAAMGLLLPAAAPLLADSPPYLTAIESSKSSVLQAPSPSPLSEGERVGERGPFARGPLNSMGLPPYLAPGHPDGVALLAPPPVAGSAEEAADLASARAVFEGRTEAEKDRATKDSTLSFSLFATVIGPVFESGQLPKTEALLQKVRKEIGEAIDTPKNHWKRRRPYQMDGRLSLGKPEPSYGYPSGHSTRGTVYASLLAELFPEKRDAILTIGRDIGWDRVLIGKHFPTDVQAGRVLGQAIIRELLSSPAFQHDLAEAKAEVEATQHSVAVPETVK